MLVFMPTRCSTYLAKALDIDLQLTRYTLQGWLYQPQPTISILTQLKISCQELFLSAKKSQFRSEPSLLQELHSNVPQTLMLPCSLLLSYE